MESIKYLVMGPLTNTQINNILKVVKEPRGGKLDAFLRRLKKGVIVDLNVKITARKTIPASKRRLLLEKLVNAGVLPDASNNSSETFPYNGGCLIVDKHQLASENILPGDLRDLNVRLKGTVHFELLRTLNKTDILAICALAGMDDGNIDAIHTTLSGTKGDVVTNRQIFTAAKTQLTEAQKNDLIVLLMNIGAIREVCSCSEGTCNPDICKRGHVLSAVRGSGTPTASPTTISADLTKFGCS